MKFERIAKLLPALALAAGVAFAPEAEAKFVFPHNHPDLDWYTIETEHFAVHYPMSRASDNPHYLESENSARLTARVAEEMWGPMCANYNYYLKERVHIVILNQTDDLEGFTVPPWDWIEVSVNPGSFFYRSRSRMEWLSDVLYHEFSHVVSLKANATMAEGAQGVLIGGLYQDGINDVDTGVEFFYLDSDPPSFSEGVAEGASEMIGGNWWTTSRDHNLRMTFLEDEGELVLSFDQWLTFAQARQSWNDFERIYQQGYAFNAYLRQRFGENVLDKAAIEAGKKWRPFWYNVLEEMTGIPPETLYNDWYDYMMERYHAQADAIRAEGEVVGRQILSSPAEWDYASPSAREAWQSKKKLEKIKAKEATGVYQIAPRYDAESGIMGINNRGAVYLSQMDIDRIEPLTGTWASDAINADTMARYSEALPADFMYSWDFVEGQNKIVVTGMEDMIASKASLVTGMDPDLKGYNFTQLFVMDIVEREDKKNGQEFTTWARDKILGHKYFEEGAARAIPNTLRAVEPNVHPDGTKIVFCQYADGTQNLATINLDGTDKQMLTDFHDGTWMQTPKWSPDGKYIAVAIFRNYRQNLYLYDVEAGTFEAITWDAWEEMDVEWSADGKELFFTADPTGVHNIFAMDLETRNVRQITNVIGSAQSGIITPEGNLVYNYYTAHGYKLYALDQADFLNKDATDMFGVPQEEEVAANWAYSEDLTHWEAKTHPYRWSKALMPPSAVPILRLENDSRTNVGLQGGFQVFMQDYVEKHGGFLYILVGEDLLFLGQYFNQMWYPNIYLMAYHYEVKYDAGYYVDFDDNPETTDDTGIYEIKNQQYANIGIAMIELPWSDRWHTMLSGMFLEYGFKTTSENEFVPYQWGYEVGLNASFASYGDYAYYAGRSPNPSAGRNIEIQAYHAYTDVVYAPYGGVTPDDGELMDAYHYNKFEMRWTEQINVPGMGIGFMQKAREKGHRIQLDGRVGMIDRNVNFNDEFRAGGQHPYYWGNSSLRPNTQFAGYPPYSLSGETMLIANAAYRFPIVKTLKQRIGPIWLDSIYGQVMGGAGNLWSYRPPDDPEKYWRNEWDERIAYDSDDIIREIPFKDNSYKTGDNFLLYDAGFELRVKGAMFNSAYWDSFLRVAYGFNDIRGYGDVDGDDIYDTSENAIGDELSNEIHPAGFRVYIGLGTGW